MLLPVGTESKASNPMADYQDVSVSSSLLQEELTFVSAVSIIRATRGGTVPRAPASHSQDSERAPCLSQSQALSGSGHAAWKVPSER